MTDRYFPNNFPDSHDRADPQFNANNTRWLVENILRIEKNLHSIDPRDGSVYTGSAGIALLYMHLARVFPDHKSQYFSKAKQNVELALKQVDERVSTFLCGAPGPLAIAAVIYHRSGDENAMNKCIEKIKSMKKHALRSSQPDEYLYGRAGYLYTLMFLRREINPEIIEDQVITEVFETMIQSGERYARQRGSSSPLLYQWYNKEYLGAAHGLTGIVYLLLKVAQQSTFTHLRPYIQSHLIPTVEYLKSKQLTSGNYVSSNESRSDELVQWCHGAPGFVYVFLQAYRATGDASYVERAIAAGDVIWKRGILRKGSGLCHGTAGNAYTFLELYRVTNQNTWLYRAMKFAEFCLENDRRPGVRTPDCPYSLFEGLAGTIYFMADILHPNEAEFPAFI